jgi:hypothetical protein
VSNFGRISDRLFPGSLSAAADAATTTSVASALKGFETHQQKFFPVGRKEIKRLSSSSPFAEFSEFTSWKQDDTRIREGANKKRKKKKTKEVFVGWR